jgi:hypothetical protein
MGRRTYKTLAPELEEYADRVIQDLEIHGYKVRAEKKELGFPHTPTLLAKRDRTTLIIEVDSSIKFDRLEAWARYGRSCGHDLRVIVCLPENVQVSVKDQDQIRAKRFGLTTISNSGTSQVIVPQDLPLNLALPDRASLPTKLKALLGATYDHFDQGSWRDGFEEASRVLEIQSRRYLKHWIRTGRIQLISVKGPRKLTASEIEKLPMGALAKAFREIAAKTSIDSQIEETLTAINDDRVSVVHHRHKKRTETRLRMNVGQNMWAIVEALKLIV